VRYGGMAAGERDVVLARDTSGQLVRALAADPATTTDP
jgi:hypothetical protein